MSTPIFDSVKYAAPTSNNFDLTHDVKTSCNMGELVPICLLETLPGDFFKIGNESLVRLQPMIAPLMHRVDVYFHYWFVPNRILWHNWENFITNGNEFPGVAPVHPYIFFTQTEYDVSKLANYFGIPRPLSNTDTPVEELINAFPFAAYQQIWNDFYRDQNLIQQIVQPQAQILLDGENTSQYASKLGILRKRAWEHDYFTSALPFAQKGEPVGIPLGQITVNDASVASGTWLSANVHAEISGAVTGNTLPLGEVTVGGTPAIYDPNGTLVNEPTLINDLRTSIKLQEWLEKNARGGTRYDENILVHWGVRSKDARLQMPEYIGGFRSPIAISEVLNTTGTAEAAQGEMAGHGISYVTGKNAKYYCQEHGWIVGIMSIMPKTGYQQGLAKKWLRKEVTDYAFPTFANLGEQEVLTKEVMAFIPEGENTFGYLPRYAEYKFESNYVTGDFKSTLDYWHLGRIFTKGTVPTLSKEFIECTPAKRVFAVETQDEDSVLVQVVNHVSVNRKLPVYGTPTF